MPEFDTGRLNREEPSLIKFYDIYAYELPVHMRSRHPSRNLRVESQCLDKGEPISSPKTTPMSRKFDPEIRAVEIDALDAPARGRRNARRENHRLKHGTAG